MILSKHFWSKFEVCATSRTKASRFCPFKLRAQKNFKNYGPTIQLFLYRYIWSKFGVSMTSRTKDSKNCPFNLPAKKIKNFGPTTQLFLYRYIWSKFGVCTTSRPKISKNCPFNLPGKKKRLKGLQSMSTNKKIIIPELPQDVSRQTTGLLPPQIPERVLRLHLLL